MPLKNWSVTPGSNVSAPPFGAPESSTKLKDMNDLIRQVMADTRYLAASSTVASAATTDLGAVDETFLTISGIATITSFGTVSAGIYKIVTFSGALTLTHNATSLILLGGVNRTTVAGDCGLYVSLGGGNWKEYFYSPVSTSSYQPLDAQLTTLAGITAQQATDLAGVSTYIGTLLNDADQKTALATLGVPLNGIYGNSAAYTVVAADRGRWLHCSGTFTLSLTALATLGPQFTFAVRNAGAGTITIDPAGTETIDGVAGLALAPGESCVVISGGAAEAWFSFGLDSSSFAANRSLASNGYQRLPGGLIIQWGVGTAGANYTNFTNNYPVAFPSVAFMIAATHEGGGVANSHINANKASLAQFNMTTGHTVNISAFFIAIGY